VLGHACRICVRLWAEHFKHGFSGGPTAQKQAAVERQVWCGKPCNTAFLVSRDFCMLAAQVKLYDKHALTTPMLDLLCIISAIVTFTITIVINILFCIFMIFYSILYHYTNL
jgi:hypothetical protein